MSITEVKNAVTQFSTEEFTEFAEWFSELQESLWDRQIENDLKSGKLDSIIQQAKERISKLTFRKIGSS